MHIWPPYTQNMAVASIRAASPLWSWSHTFARQVVSASAEGPRRRLQPRPRPMTYLVSETLDNKAAVRIRAPSMLGMRGGWGRRGPDGQALQGGAGRGRRGRTETGARCGTNDVTTADEQAEHDSTSDSADHTQPTSLLRTRAVRLSMAPWSFSSSGSLFPLTQKHTSSHCLGGLWRRTIGGLDWFSDTVTEDLGNVRSCAEVTAGGRQRPVALLSCAPSKMATVATEVR
jgi:hypothetical protein